MDKLDRNTYKLIKGMNREQLEKLLNNVYEEGVNSANGSRVTAKAISEKIQSIPGIGEKRLAQIMDKISELF